MSYFGYSRQQGEAAGTGAARLGDLSIVYGKYTSPTGQYPILDIADGGWEVVGAEAAQLGNLSIRYGKFTSPIMACQRATANLRDVNLPCQIHIGFVAIALILEQE